MIVSKPTDLPSAREAMDELLAIVESGRSLDATAKALIERLGVYRRDVLAAKCRAVDEYEAAQAAMPEALAQAAFDGLPDGGSGH